MASNNLAATAKFSSVLVIYILHADNLRAPRAL